MAGGGGVLGALTGNFVVEQIVAFNLAGTVINAAITPFVTELVATVNSAAPNARLTPAEAAEAQLRNVISRDRAAEEARAAGVNSERYDVLARLAGNAPAPESLAEALRRGIIDDGRYLDGIRQGRLRDEWAETIKALAVREPSPSDAMEALLEGQLDEATARSKFAAYGGPPAEFDWLFNTRGSAPTPNEAATMANRGIIPWEGSGPGATSFEQAFLEGPWRNKWLGAWRQMARYLPPPRTVVAMVRSGSMSDEQADELLRAQGLTPELADAYLADAHQSRVEATKTVAQSVVVEAYDDRLIGRATAATMLGELGYAEPEAEFVLAVADVRLSQRYLSSAVGRVHTLFVGHKIDQSETLAALAALGVESDDQTTLLTIWGHEREANVKTLTPAQIVSAWHLGIMPQDRAVALLRGQGYDDYDAWVMLSIKAKEALPDQPTPPAPEPI